MSLELIVEFNISKLCFHSTKSVTKVQHNKRAALIIYKETWKLPDWGDSFHFLLLMSGISPRCHRYKHVPLRPSPLLAIGLHAFPESRLQLIRICKITHCASLPVL
uniref:Uncharacterized protein n=1 Tax=Arundo donax TaxID=35708 RepID=A0A0A9FR48_ARUDO